MSLRRGGAIPTGVTLRNALTYAPELAMRPRWLYDFARDGLRLDVPNVRTSPDGPRVPARAGGVETPGAARYAWRGGRGLILHLGPVCTAPPRAPRTCM